MLIRISFTCKDKIAFIYRKKYCFSNLKKLLIELIGFSFESYGYLFGKNMRDCFSIVFWMFQSKEIRRKINCGKWIDIRNGLKMKVMWVSKGCFIYSEWVHSSRYYILKFIFIIIKLNISKFKFEFWVLTLILKLM